MPSTPERRKEWYEKNREVILLKKQLYYLDNREKCLESIKKWHVEHRDRHRELSREYRERIRREVFEHYGNKCACCGETEIDFLTIDHINNDGALERKGGPGTSTGINSYVKIKKSGYPKTLQLLCFNCNCARFYHKVCPHKRGNGDASKIGV